MNVIKHILAAAILVFSFTSIVSFADQRGINAVSVSTAADSLLAANQDIPLTEKYLADIVIHSPEELYAILARADKLLKSGKFALKGSSPIVFLLHGDEAHILFKGQYEKNKPVIDLAAKLTAFNVVDIKICDIWMQSKNLYSRDLQPFVGVVRNAIAEASRLIDEEQYQYF